MTKTDVKIFLKASALTALCIIVFSGIYLGFCESYEAIRSVRFGDERPAVAIGEGYLKFFDCELFF